MPRPILPAISSGVAGWDAQVDDIVESLTQRPLPLAVVADVPTLLGTFAPGLYEDCLVIVTGPPKGLFSSDGTNWLPI